MSTETVLRKKRIAVVSKRRSVSDFFRLEGESQSCFVSIMSIMPIDPFEYDIVILDDDGSYSVQYNYENLYRIISDDDIQGDKILSWPVSVFKVREIFEGYVAQDTHKINNNERNFLYLKEGKTKEVIYKNKKIPLTECEWRLLVCLAKKKGEAVDRETLRRLFDAENGNITDVYICHLRRKLEEPFGEKIIRTVRGKGYLLTIDTKIE